MGVATRLTIAILWKATSPDDIDECEVDNGGCGDPRFTRCLNAADRRPTAKTSMNAQTITVDAAIDRVQLRHLVGAPPLCEAALETPNWIMTLCAICIPWIMHSLTSNGDYQTNWGGQDE